MIKKNIRLLENPRKLLKIFTSWLGLARIFLENEFLENARLEFYFPCSNSPNTNYLTKNLDAFNLRLFGLSIQLRLSLYIIYL